MHPFSTKTLHIRSYQIQFIIKCPTARKMLEVCIESYCFTYFFISTEVPFYIRMISQIDIYAIKKETQKFKGICDTGCVRIFIDFLFLKINAT